MKFNSRIETLVTSITLSLAVVSVAPVSNVNVYSEIPSYSHGLDNQSKAVVTVAHNGEGQHHDLLLKNKSFSTATELVLQASQHSAKYSGFAEIARSNLFTSQLTIESEDIKIDPSSWQEDFLSMRLANSNSFDTFVFAHSLNSSRNSFAKDYLSLVSLITIVGLIFVTKNEQQSH